MSMRWLRSHLVLILGILVLVYTFVPIFIVVLMSFNKLPNEQSKIYKFNSFTLDNWLHPCADPSMCDALSRSVEIGFLATLGATILGTLAAFALVRHDFCGRSTTNILIFLPMAAPEIVMGSSLLALFVSAGFAGQLGFWTILIAHIMFCLSFVVVTVRSRLAGLSDTLEQAAADLYATPNQTFWRVTFPLRPARHRGRGDAELLAVVRRLHHHQPERRQHHDVPDVRLGRLAQDDPDADQRRRHGDAADLGADRGRRRGQRPTSPPGVQERDSCQASGARGEPKTEAESLVIVGPRS